MKKVLSLLLSLAMVLSLTSPVIAVNIREENDSEQNDIRKDKIAAEVLRSQNVETFGGIYYDEAGNLVVCEKGTSAQLQRSLDVTSPDVIFKTVKYSLAELEGMKNAFVPYMEQFGITTLDANESTNKVDITVEEYSLELEEFILTILPLEDCNIIVSEPDVVRQFTIGPSMKGTSVEEELQQAENLDVSLTAGLSIFPGSAIYVGSDLYLCTAGPRISSTKYYTCGHVLDNYFNSAQSVYSLGIAVNTVIGTTSNKVFGANGDRCTVTIRNCSLPSSNMLLTGETYTIDSIAMGKSVQMWGAVSGVSTGKVTGTGLVVTVDGTTVGGLSKATYTCKNGDSGAGVFTTSGNIVCGGTQSIGEGLSGDTFRTSYFSTLY